MWSEPSGEMRRARCSRRGFLQALRPAVLPSVSKKPGRHPGEAAGRFGDPGGPGRPAAEGRPGKKLRAGDDHQISAVEILLQPRATKPHLAGIDDKLDLT